MKGWFITVQVIDANVNASTVRYVCAVSCIITLLIRVRKLS